MLGSKKVYFVVNSVLAMSFETPFEASRENVVRAHFSAVTWTDTSSMMAPVESRREMEPSTDTLMGSGSAGSLNVSDLLVGRRGAVGVTCQYRGQAPESSGMEGGGGRGQNLRDELTQSLT